MGRPRARSRWFWVQPPVDKKYPIGYNKAVAKLNVGKEKRRRQCDHCHKRLACQYVECGTWSGWYCSVAVGELLAQERN